MQRITGSVGSYQSGARNSRGDVETIQRMLEAAATKLRKPQYNPKGVDGLINRIADRSETVKAITAFQKEQVGMMRPDRRVDVNGLTWKTLTRVAGPLMPKPSTPAKGLITLTVSHGGLVPKGTTRRRGQIVGSYDGAYESTFVLSGGLSGNFRGSIWPNDMTVKGHLVDGTYPLHIGFHKGGGKAKQKSSDLVVRTKGIRAGLLVNARNGVTVQSDEVTKTTSYGINVHNGLSSTKRSSDGCLNLPPEDWKRFIKLFLDAFPNIDDWHTIGPNTGKKIGNLIVQR